ncbi:MAG: leucine-rich repeat protein, partial [Lachnospiraceae bacterium]|nr:leucine-rich repeat protein [Lachnospiraceae bacterium]
MSKKGKKRVLNRKLKRTIRYTFATLCMITAITVAAIPAPKNEAADPTNNNFANDISDDRDINYSEFSRVGDPEGLIRTYPVYDDRIAASGNKDIDSAASGGSYYKKVDMGEIDLSEYHQGSSSVLYGYSVVRLSNGYYLNWQYKYYLEGTTGVLCDYNDDFAVEVQTLSLRLPTGYITVDPSVVNEYFQTGDGSQAQKIEYTKDYSNETTDDYAKFDKYYNAEFAKWRETCAEYERDLETYQTALKKYQDDLAAWDSDQTGNKPVAPTAPTVPAACQFYPSGLIDSLRRQYYCDYELEYNGQKGIKGLGQFSLVAVQDAREGAIKDTYLIQAVDPDTASDEITKYLDTNNFLCEGISPHLITAIGDYAFNNVRNIETMNMPEEIAYVGDYAFYNSFIKHVNLSNVKMVGNAAFKSTQLESVNLGTGLTVIGAEAFSNNSKLTSVEFPVTINTIGNGAFSGCLSLVGIDFSTINSSFDIGQFAFYDCQSLSQVTFPDGVTNKNLQSIGIGAFSVERGSTSDAEISIIFPTNLTDLPDFLFAGRSNLQSVTFPASYGSSAPGKEIPKNMFLGCTNLSSVTFPDSCLYVTYGSKNYEFYDVQNPDFFVQGPAYMSNRRDVAKPREATWYERTYVNDFVPYCFVWDGQECYEAGYTADNSDSSYILTVDNNGSLISCIDAPGSIGGSIDLIIPEKVGAHKVVSVVEGCFDEIKESISSVTVADNSISEIGSRTFKDCTNLSSVEIGNSVERIGDEAFFNCPKLKHVTFHTPSSGYNNFTIGNNAFETKSTELTFHGDINKDFAPFSWAMQADNYVDEQTGVRVCYESLTNLKVMYDQNQNGEITLIDYPKYIELDTVHQDHNKKMEKYYYDTYKDSDYDRYREQFLEEWDKLDAQNGTVDGILKQEDKEALYESDYYGPWVNNTFISSTTWNKNNIIAASDPNNTTSSAIEQLFPKLIAYADEDKPVAYFITYPYSILDNIESNSNKVWQTLTPEEVEWIDACINIVVPEEITSVDVNTFINGVGSTNYNRNNVITYLYNNTNSYEMYRNSDTAEKVIGGLFSGYFDDKLEEDYEKEKKGNDYVQTITLLGIKSLPDYCFDSCEKLYAISLGDECTDVGTAPFRGCTSLTSVAANNDYFVCDNGILYEKLEDSKYRIIECLASRGNVVGQPLVSSANDSLIPYISEIDEGAFQNCDGITYVDLEDSLFLEEIPEDAFRECKNLAYVILPESVNSIQDHAFAGNERIDVTIPGKEVFIATSAFEPRSTVNIRTYLDTSAYEYGKYYGQTVTLIGDTYRVVFLDYDGTQIGETQYIEDGKNATPPADPVRTGYTFTGWSGSYNGITQDTILVAQYQAEG